MEGKAEELEKALQDLLSIEEIDWDCPVCPALKQIGSGPCGKQTKNLLDCYKSSGKRAMWSCTKVAKSQKDCLEASGNKDLL